MKTWKTYTEMSERWRFATSGSGGLPSLTFHRMRPLTTQAIFLILALTGFVGIGGHDKTHGEIRPETLWFVTLFDILIYQILVVKNVYCLLRILVNTIFSCQPTQVTSRRTPSQTPNPSSTWPTDTSSSRSSSRRKVCYKMNLWSMIVFSEKIHALLFNAVTLKKV